MNCQLLLANHRVPLWKKNYLSKLNLSSFCQLFSKWGKIFCSVEIIKITYPLTTASSISCENSWILNSKKILCHDEAKWESFYYESFSLFKSHSVPSGWKKTYEAGECLFQFASCIISRVARKYCAEMKWIINVSSLFNSHSIPFHRKATESWVKRGTPDIQFIRQKFPASLKERW